MPPRTSPAIRARQRSAFRLYRVSSYITGTFLLLLVIEMIFKYIPALTLVDGEWITIPERGFEFDLGGENGFLALVSAGSTTGLNLSLAVLIVHGWFYVLYLFADFQLWTRMRWPFSRFILIALGGIVPFLSFFVEHSMAKKVAVETAEPTTPQPAEAPA